MVQKPACFNTQTDEMCLFRIYKLLFDFFSTKLQSNLI